MDKSKEKAQLIEAAFAPFVKKPHVRQMIVSAGSMDGDFAYDFCAGHLEHSDEAVGKDTPFMIASVTKLFIASTVLRLYEEEKIVLEETIGHYLEDSLIKGIHVYKGKERHDLITVRHLLTHTSGILDYIEIKNEQKKTIFDDVIGGRLKTFDVPLMLSIVKKARGAYFDVSPWRKVKMKARYSDTNFQLLRLIIEKTSGMTCAEAIKHYVLNPLKMHDTFLPLDKHERHVSTLYMNETPLLCEEALRSFGDYYSTTGDLFRFMKGLYQGGLFKHEQTRALMLEDYKSFGVSFSPVSPAWPIAYAHGMMRFKVPKMFTGFKEMPALYGHTGVGSAFLFYCEALDLMIAGTLNQVRYTATPFRVLPKLLMKLKRV